MATLDDVRRIALALPGTEESGSYGSTRSWKVKRGLVAWERPLGKAELAALGDAAPSGTILGVRVPDLGAKEAILADDPEVFFTTPHFTGYPAVLVRLDVIGLTDLEEVVVEAWLDRAPKKLVAEYLAASGG